MARILRLGVSSSDIACSVLPLRLSPPPSRFELGGEPRARPMAAAAATASHIAPNIPLRSRRRAPPPRASAGGSLTRRSRQLRCEFVAGGGNGALSGEDDPRFIDRVRIASVLPSSPFPSVSFLLSFGRTSDALFARTSLYRVLGDAWHGETVFAVFLRRKTSMSDLRSFGSGVFLPVFLSLVWHCTEHTVRTCKAPKSFLLLLLVSFSDCYLALGTLINYVSKLCHMKCGRASVDNER